MDKRSERMLEDILKLPGNDKCADCRAAAPRWASVNLGIFLCVGCASVHRKLGTHKSRVKSVTLDTWSRDQLATMRSLGNTASNLIYNPDERRNPPPTSSSGSDDRDGDLEKFIRRKYEQGAFKAGAQGSAMVVPNSMNRARVAAGKPELRPGVGTGGIVRSTSWTNPNSRNPELNDVLIGKEKDLPGLPKGAPVAAIPIQHSGPSQPPRQRPTPTRGNTPQSTGGSLIDMGEGVSATVPLQMSGYSGGQGYQAQMQAQGQGGSWGNGASFIGSTSPYQNPFPTQQSFQPQQYQPSSQPYQFQNPQQSSSFGQNSQQQPMSFGSSSYNQQLQPQMAFQQPQQSMGYQQQSFLPVPPQQQQQYGGQMLGMSPNGMGQMYGQGSPGQGMMQGSPNGNWQGQQGMGMMNGNVMGMGTVYGQGMR